MWLQLAFDWKYLGHVATFWAFPTNHFICVLSQHSANNHFCKPCQGPGNLTGPNFPSWCPAFRFPQSTPLCHLSTCWPKACLLWKQRPTARLTMHARHKIRRRDDEFPWPWNLKRNHDRIGSLVFVYSRPRSCLFMFVKYCYYPPRSHAPCFREHEKHTLKNNKKGWQTCKAKQNSVSYFVISLDWIVLNSCQMQDRRQLLVSWKGRQIESTAEQIILQLWYYGREQRLQSKVSSKTGQPLLWMPVACIVEPLISRFKYKPVTCRLFAWKTVGIF